MYTTVGFYEEHAQARLASQWYVQDYSLKNFRFVSSHNYVLYLQAPSYPLSQMPAEYSLSNFR